MKKLSLLFTLISFLTLGLHAQQLKSVKISTLTETSVVKDSTGMQYPYVAWKKMVKSGNYAIKRKGKRTDSTEFVLVKLTEDQKDTKFSKMAKPTESKYFTVGEKISSFSTSDINGNKIKLKDLIGKVVVLNFWFIGCPPCRKEIPELNKLALKYADDPNVVFIAVALDQRDDIRQFIKTMPFGYHIVDDGRMYASLYKINSFPTNLVLNKEGKVMFHSTGYNITNPYWINKNIEDAEETAP